MRVMVIVKANEKSEAGVMPSEALITAMGNYNEELVNAGVMKAGEGLHPSSAGKRVIFSGGKHTIIDGPFAETKELIAGFWLWEVKDMDDALAWVKKMPNPAGEGDGAIEIRPVTSARSSHPKPAPRKTVCAPSLRPRRTRTRSKAAAQQTA
jgi:hypothetical protein